ncbi:probable ATP-dependent RNA helicase kurz [Formica exsecta]|uniref:probable ATP-dependent RNA helicase kurz n=1 Tax=Formica exsecta TaxID=72781 RepID=UPI001144766D|nr:probable ATP-dependent RNA helicase kurz [Formica exsecta]
MEKRKKIYNLKSETVANTKVDNSTMKEIVIDIEHRADDYDSCNALVLSTKKTKTKNIHKKVKTQLLSKKRRKQLEKVVEKKKKKLQRATLLEDLAKYQASSHELQQYTSLTSLQNKGLKRHFRQLEMPVSKLKCMKHEIERSDTIETTFCANSIKGSKKKRFAILDHAKQDKTTFDPNMVGFESSDSSNENDYNNENKAYVSDNTAISTEKEKKNENFLEDGQKKTVPAKSQKSEKPIGKPVVSKACISTIFVPVNRKQEIQATRLKLPIVAEEQVIVETINENPITIITGETGSGKTTQVPQFLYEAGYAQNKLIGITEPRRVAAMSMSKRVAEEMNLTEKQVSYLIRFEGNVTEETKIKYMTDGVLLKEIQSDFLLKKYSVIILDEAHERSVYTDILIGLLSRIVPLRNKRNDPLKLIIMSATLRVEEFVENMKLFKVKPPVITVEARQFPVTIHFNRRTNENYVNEALRKTVKIHTCLPEGGILIFLTGQQEVHTIVRKLRKLFPLKKNKIKLVDSEKSETFLEEVTSNEHSNHDDSDDNFDTKKALCHNKQRKKKPIILPTINLDDYSTTLSLTDDTHEDLINVQDDEDNLDEDEDEDEFIDFKLLTNTQPLWILPLYSLLPSHKQARVFEPPPEGCRLCVVSTNVAETSLTIPNIRYVIDSGRCKTRLYDKVTGVSTYHICYTSKAAAKQRAGRAGRTRPGHCYRLYSSAVYNDQFEEYSQSEIRKKPVDDLLLQMKAMNIDKVVNFPFPTPPDIVQLKFAEKRLTILGALQSFPMKQELYCAKVTLLGRSIATFPVIPRYGKMLALSHQHNLLTYTICMVAALSVQEVLIEALGIDSSAKHKWLSMRRCWAGTGNSLLLGDPMVLIKVIGFAEYAGSKGRLLPFCEKTGLRHKAVIEIRKLRQQLTNEINLNIPDLNLTINPKMSPPTDMKAKLLRQIILAGMADQIAKKVSSDEIKEDQDKIKWKHAYRTSEMEEPIFMHSSCVLRKTNPEWVVYQELYETNKIYMRNVTAIEPEWLPKFAPTLCNLSEPLIDPPPRYDRETGKIICRVCGTFGSAGWKLPPMDIEHPLTVDGIKWFAFFFLEGQICPKLKRFVPSLLTTPGSITKSWAKLIPRTQAIVQALLSHEIMSKDKLLQIWSSDKKFLLAPYQKWLPESAHMEVAFLWPPL